MVSTVHSDYKLDYMGRPFARLTFGAINAMALRRLDYRIGVSDAMVDLLISRGFPPTASMPSTTALTSSRPASGRSAGISAESGGGCGREQRGGGHRRPSESRQGYVHPDPRLCRGHKTCSRLRLVIAGDGEERQKLGDLAKELGVEKEVTFAGWISGGMDQFYAALDINALTSLSETFPYALTEGARFHLATVATAVGGIPYLIDQGVNGYLLTPGDWQNVRVLSVRAGHR